MIDPEIVIKLRSLEHSKDGLHGGGVKDHLSGEPGALGQHLNSALVELIATHDRLDEPSSRPRGFIEDVEPRISHGRGQSDQRALGDPLSDALRLFEATQDGINDFVNAAGANRVVS